MKNKTHLVQLTIILFTLLGGFGFYKIASGSIVSTIIVVVPQAGGGTIAYCKEPDVIKEKRAELKSSIALAETNIKIIQNKLIERYNHPQEEFNTLIKNKENELLAENNTNTQAKSIEYINCLKLAGGNFNFNISVFNDPDFDQYLYRYYEGVGNSSADSSLRAYESTCYNFKGDAVILGYKFKEKAEEMINYKIGLDQEYDMVNLKSKIENLGKTIAYYTDLLKEEIMPCCTNWVYSSWGECIYGQQTRKIISSQPTNCTGGSPILTQSCTFIPLCTESNWTSALTPLICPINNQQTKTWTKTGSCQGGISHPSQEIVNCNYNHQPSTCANRSCQEGLKIEELEKTPTVKVDNNLSKKVSGNILLQVESKGEGWYVYPDDKKKYYLGRPADAFNIMKKLGLGIKHEELANYLNSKFPSRLSGKIVLDVERNGEAYYINPKDLKSYFLNRPSDAFKIMIKLGLGITNSDITKIAEGEVR